MPLPDEFAFSQAALADYLDCRRRFQYRYLARLAWPAIEMEPALDRERRMLHGQAFHRWIQRYIAGLPAASLDSALRHDPTLARWWQAFQAHPLPGLPVDRQAEVRLAAGLAGYRLLATLDMVAVDPGARAVIVDWKTGARPEKEVQWADRAQTRVYRYLLVRAGAFLNGGREWQPEQVVMAYWFAESPAEPVWLPYDRPAFEDDAAFLEAWIETIATTPEDGFPLTDDVRRCTTCVYRSLCQRGVQAGPLQDEPDSETDSLADFDLDFDQIAEVAF